VPLERISIELTNRCTKACWFCYNHSLPEGETRWAPDEVIGFIRDCAANGVKAVSFGGGEPLQYPGLFDVLKQLEGTLFRSVTTNGLMLHGKTLDCLIGVRPDKVHVSIHFPERDAEVNRVIEHVVALTGRGIRGGVNLLVSRSNLDRAAWAARQVRAAGIGNDRIVYLPMRGRDTPTPEELADVAGRTPFQSMTCLTKCGPSPRFASIGWDRMVAWCSYTESRRALPEPTYLGLVHALDDLQLRFCGGIEGDGELGRRQGLRVLVGNNLCR
jgi:MoaA/NifB/PqqE/SkfB family radical SAM enzyme